MQRPIELKKVRTSQFNGLILHAAFLIEIGELKNENNPLCLGFYCLMSGGQHLTIWSGRWAMENCTNNACMEHGPMELTVGI